MTNHDQIVERAIAILTEANEPTRLKVLRQGIPNFDGQYVAVSLHQEAHRVDPRIVRVGFGVYALPEWDTGQGEWRSEHQQMVDAAHAVLADADRPLTVNEVWEYIEGQFSLAKLRSSLARESRRPAGRVARVGYGLYTVTPSPVKPKAPEPPESPKSYIEALCDVLRTYEPDLTDEQRKAVGEALKDAVSLVVVPEREPPAPSKRWLTRLGLGD